MGQDIWQVIEYFHQACSILTVFGTTFITLVPKSSKYMAHFDYCLIALCNIIQKIISNVMANHLKPILSSMISLEQTGYVEGQQIQDNIIFAHQHIHSLQSPKMPSIVIKLYISKIFDKLSQKFIFHTLKTFNFNEKWIHWVMALISKYLFSFLINGSPSTTFGLTCGIRQGDPMSQYIFLLMARRPRQKYQERSVTRTIPWTPYGHLAPMLHPSMIF